MIQSGRGLSREDEDWNSIPRDQVKQLGLGARLEVDRDRCVPGACWAASLA